MKTVGLALHFIGAPLSSSLRSLPRLFVQGASPDAEIELPSEELHKLRSVLRLSPGARIAVLPDDGTLIECELLPRAARPIHVHHPDTEPGLKITLAQSLPKGDKLDEIVRACTEVGVSGFLLFSSDRTVVRWDEQKSGAKLRRIQAIAREAAEVSFRTRLPLFAFSENLEGVLRAEPGAIVLSESESALKPLESGGLRPVTLVIGPEGGWSPRELALIGDRGVTLGPRVLRVEHAGFAACASLLLAETGAKERGPAAV